MVLGCASGGDAGSSGLTFGSRGGGSNATGTSTTGGEDGSGDGSTGFETSGSGNAQDCCQTHGAPECAISGINACVCADQPSCCEAAWTAVCVAAAASCGATCEAQTDSGLPSEDCCLAKDEPGCTDASTELCVCDSDPLCCSTAWTDACAALAAECSPLCGGGGETGDTGEAVLPCDPGWSFSPAPTANGAFEATYSNAVGLVHIGMRAVGPSGQVVSGSDESITGNGPYFWSYDFSGLVPGVWLFEFTRDMGVVQAACSREL